MQKKMLLSTAVRFSYGYHLTAQQVGCFGREVVTPSLGKPSAGSSATIGKTEAGQLFMHVLETEGVRRCVLLLSTEEAFAMFFVRVEVYSNVSGSDIPTI